MKFYWKLRRACTLFLLFWGHYYYFSGEIKPLGMQAHLLRHVHIPAGRLGITSTAKKCRRPPRESRSPAGGGSRGAAPSSAPPPPREAGRGWRSEGVKGRRFGNLMLTKPQECCTFPFPSSFRRRSVPAAGSSSEEPSPEAALAPGAAPHLPAGYAGRRGEGRDGAGGGWCEKFFPDLGCSGGTCKTEGERDGGSAAVRTPA